MEWICAPKCTFTIITMLPLLPIQCQDISCHSPDLGLRLLFRRKQEKTFWVSNSFQSSLFQSSFFLAIKDLLLWSSFVIDLFLCNNIIIPIYQNTITEEWDLKSEPLQIISNNLLVHHHQNKYLPHLRTIDLSSTYYSIVISIHLLPDKHADTPTEPISLLSHCIIKRQTKTIHVHQQLIVSKTVNNTSLAMARFSRTSHHIKLFPTPSSSTWDRIRDHIEFNSTQQQQRQRVVKAKRLSARPDRERLFCN